MVFSDNKRLKLMREVDERKAAPARRAGDGFDVVGECAVVDGARSAVEHAEADPEAGTNTRSLFSST